jgi:hypothetical protein
MPKRKKSAPKGKVKAKPNSTKQVTKATTTKKSKPDRISSPTPSMPTPGSRAPALPVQMKPNIPPSSPGPGRVTTGTRASIRGGTPRGPSPSSLVKSSLAHGPTNGQPGGRVFSDRPKRKPPKRPSK